MNNVILDVILPGIVAICVAVITGLLIPFLRKKLKLSGTEAQIAEKALQSAEAALNKENIEKITSYIEQLVKSAEEKGRNGEIKTGSEKFTYVFDLAKDLVATFNIVVPDDYIKALISSKVTELIAQGIKKID